MDGLFADHTRHFAVGGDDIHLTGWDIEFVDAAIGAEVKKSFIRNVNDLKSDLVVVTGKHDSDRSRSI